MAGKPTYQWGNESRTFVTGRNFPLGKLLVTPGVFDGFKGEILIDCLSRHEQCDWGDLDADDWQTNDAAVKDGDERLLSVYNLPTGTVWIITEADRSATTILLPSEY